MVFLSSLPAGDARPARGLSSGSRLSYAALACACAGAALAADVFAAVAAVAVGAALGAATMGVGAVVVEALPPAAWRACASCAAMAGVSRKTGRFPGPTSFGSVTPGAEVAMIFEAYH